MWVEGPGERKFGLGRRRGEERQRRCGVWMCVDSPWSHSRCIQPCKSRHLVCTSHSWYRRSHPNTPDHHTRATLTVIAQPRQQIANHQAILSAAGLLNPSSLLRPSILLLGFHRRRRGPPLFDLFFRPHRKQVGMPLGVRHSPAGWMRTPSLRMALSSRRGYTIPVYPFVPKAIST